MKLGTVAHQGMAVPVLNIEQGLFDLHAALASLPPGRAADFGLRPGEVLTMLQLAAHGDVAHRLGREVAADPDGFAGSRLNPDQVQPMAPIPRPPKNVFCVGRNYVEHIQEDNVSRAQSTKVPEHPQYFTKPATAIIGDGGEVRYDERVTRRLDYEVELAVVIGRGGRDITAERAFEHVFGYTIVNDISARDLQKRHDQWFKGKALDTTCPMGPWIVTADEIADPHALAIELDVNGEARQRASTGDMIFRIPKLIETLSAGLTLEPGDILATGTPSGVGYAMEPRRWLAPGDVITCRVERIGTLTNRVVAAGG